MRVPVMQEKNEDFSSFKNNIFTAFAAIEQATLSCVNMNLAASSGAIGWVLFDLMMDRKLSPCGLFYGAVNGIVVITPASGYINPKFVFVISSISVVVCNLGCRWKTRWELDDAMDVFMFHGLSGIVGMLLTVREIAFDLFQVYLKNYCFIIPGRIRRAKIRHL